MSNCHCEKSCVPASKGKLFMPSQASESSLKMVDFYYIPEAYFSH